MRIARFVAAGVLVAAVVAAVEAQPPGGGRFQGGGMFGGGQQSVSSLVLTNTALHEELKVTDDQKTKFKEISEKQLESFKKLGVGGAGGKGGKGGKGAFDKDKMAEMRKEMAKIQEETKTAVDGTLTTTQKTRLTQIERQQQGVRAFAVEEVATALKLTDDQKDKIKGIAEELTKDETELRRGAFGGGGFDAEKMAEVTKKTQRVRREALEKVTTALTAEQKAEWTKMTGEAFDLSKLTPQVRR